VDHTGGEACGEVPTSVVYLTVVGRPTSPKRSGPPRPLEVPMASRYDAGTSFAKNKLNVYVPVLPI